MTARRLLLIHPSRLDGENRGLHVQHVASMQWLLNAEHGWDHGWDMVAMDMLHPALPEVALTSDVVIVHMLGGREIESLLRLRRERGLKTLIEIGDNFLDLGTWLPKKHTLRNPLVRQQILYHASISDGVQVYSEGLAELFRHVHRDVVVLDPYVPLARRTAADGPFVVGWGGTTSHAEDLQRIAPVIVGFCRRHPDAIFAYMGDAALFTRFFSEIPAAQTRVRNFGPYAEYLEFVSSLDAGIAPLGASGFNAGRTDTKFATYAARGVAAVLEDSDVYRIHADRAMLFASTAELDAALESLYVDPALRLRLAHRAYEWAARERSPERLRAQRIAAYESLAPQEMTEHEPVKTSPEHGELTAAFLIKEPDAAIAALEAIVAQYPRYDQARIALCRSYENRGEHGRAFELLENHEVSPLYADLSAEMQARQIRHVRPDEASRYEARVASPLVRARLDHRKRDVREYLRVALERQPYDYLALATVIRELLAHDPSSPDLPDLCLRACLIAPELVPLEHRPASLTRYLPA
jgi:hypothetical protein